MAISSSTGAAMRTPSQACRVLGWTRLLDAAPEFADCWTAVEIAFLLALGLAPNPSPTRNGRGAEVSLVSYASTLAFNSFQASADCCRHSSAVISPARA